MIKNIQKLNKLVIFIFFEVEIIKTKLKIEIFDIKLKIKKILIKIFYF